VRKLLALAEPKSAAAALQSTWWERQCVEDDEGAMERGKREQKGGQVKLSDAMRER